MRDFLKHSSLVFAGTLGANVLFYVAYALVQRGLGVENAGLFMALLATTQLLSVPATVLGTVVAKMSADAAVQGRRGALRALSRYTSLVFVPLVLFAGIASTVASPWLQSYFHTPDSLAIGFAALAFALFFPLAPQRAVFQGGGLFGAFIASSVLEAALKAGTGATLFAFRGGVRFAFAGFAAATAVSFLFNATLGMRSAPCVEPIRLPAETVRKHLIGVVLPVSGLTAITFADAILVRHYLSAYDSGLYAIIALVGRAIVTITQFVPTVLMPKATEAAAQGRSPAPLLGLAAAATAVVVLPVVLLVWFFPSRIASGLAGGAFLPAAPLMPPYALAMTGLAGATVLATYLIGINRRGFAIPMTAVCFAEIVAIALVHPGVTAVVHIVLAGHLSAFACTVIATLASLRAPTAIDEDAIGASEIVAAHLAD